MGKTRADLVVRYEDDDLARKIEGLIAERKPFRDLIYLRRTHDGREIWVRVSGAPRYSSDGTFLGYHGAGSEITAAMIVRADPEQLFRVVSNLVRNARQAIVATRKPGSVTVSASEDALNWRIEVADTGPGLPAKAKEHLFTAFQGGARKGGSGLGLAIAAELVRGHGGTLSLIETGPEGTIFAVVLPKGDGTV